MLFLAARGALLATACLLANFASPATGVGAVDSGACDAIAERVENIGGFVASLRPGETGCLRGGVYRSERTIKLSRPGITLTALGGNSTLIGRLWISSKADRTTIRGLKLNGRNGGDLPSPTVNADDVRFRGNDVTNGRTATCFLLGSPRFGMPERTVIEGNRIHDCGEIPATNHHHGIYIAHASGTVVKGNLIADNADRGIQLYPNADGSSISGNVISGNGQGIIFSGSANRVSEGNHVTSNVIKNSRIRFNVESHWQGERIGRGNLVRSNCIFGGSRGANDGGIESPTVGFTARKNWGRSGPCASGRSGEGREARG